MGTNNKNNILFSVVISAYNKEKFIKETIKSVLRQNEQDFEIIVVDDGSTDNTKSRIEEIKDRRIKYIYQRPSGLPACARNRGIERASGKYIALLDGDDRWLAEKLEKTLDIFSKNPKTDIVCHDLRIVSENAKFIRRTFLGPYPKDVYGKLLWDSNCFVITTTVLKREVFFEHNFWFDENDKLFSVEDYDFWLRLAETEKFNFYYLSEVLAEHVVSEKGIVLNDIGKNAENFLYLFDRNVKSYGSENPEKKALIKKRRSSIMRGAGLSCNYKKDYCKSLYWFLKAIKEYPFCINTYIGFVSSFFRLRLGRV